MWATVALSIQNNPYHFIKTIVWVSFNFFKPSGLTKFVREINSGVIEVYDLKKKNCERACFGNFEIIV